MSAEAALRALLLSLFTSPELRVWLRFGSAEQAALLVGLPGPTVSHDELVAELVAASARRGLIDHVFFLALITERPRRLVEIVQVARVWGVHLTESEVTLAAGSTGIAPTSRLSRVELVDSLEELLVERERLQHRGLIPADLGERLDELVQSVMAGQRPRAGDIVAGARLTKPVGTGNFGTIWQAEGPGGEVWAVKVFHQEKLGEGVMLWRFRRSIKAMTRLSERRDAPPSIARLHEVAEDGLAFSMPYYEGGNLETIAKRGWSLQTRLDRFLEICRAVAFAHRAGIIHRDIKPANVVLDADGRPVLTDFDISDIKFATKLSTAGGLGTPIFAAPEQLEQGDRADERSDVYSLGRLLHFLVLERSPGYQDERDPSLANLSALPEALVAVVRRACQWAPERRYPDVESLISEVEAHQSGLAAVKAHARRTTRWVRYNWALLLVAGLVSGGSLGAYLWQRQVAEREAALSGQLRDALTQLTALGKRQEELNQRGVDLASQLAGLERDRARWIAERDAPGRSRSDQQELDARITTQDELIASVKEQIAENQAAQARLLEQVRGAQKVAQEVQEARAEDPQVGVVVRDELVLRTEEPQAMKVEERGATPSVPIAVPPVSARSSGEPVGSIELAIPGSTETLVFVKLSKGRYCMGSPDEVGDEDEHPQHVVNVSTFAMGQSEVTQAQWAAVVAAAQAAGDDDAKALTLRPSRYSGDNLPVESVSWCDAARWANAASRLTGRTPVYIGIRRCEKGSDVGRDPTANGLRLPTEAEWEYAARAGTTTAYATGDAEADLARVGWYDGNNGEKPHPVCTAEVKPWGLCDMHGNVWEWTWDWYGPYQSAEASNPTGAPGGTKRVLRGGSWNYTPEYARSASRPSERPTAVDRNWGFRVVVPIAYRKP